MHKSIRQPCRCSEGGKNELRHRIQQQNRQHRTAGTDPAGAAAAGRLLLFRRAGRCRAGSRHPVCGFLDGQGQGGRRHAGFLAAAARQAGVPVWHRRLWRQCALLRKDSCRHPEGAGWQQHRHRQLYVSGQNAGVRPAAVRGHEGKAFAHPQSGCPDRKLR